MRTSATEPGRFGAILSLESPEVLHYEDQNAANPTLSIPCHPDSETMGISFTPARPT